MVINFGQCLNINFFQPYTAAVHFQDGGSVGVSGVTISMGLSLGILHAKAKVIQSPMHPRLKIGNKSQQIQPHAHKCPRDHPPPSPGDGC